VALGRWRGSVAEMDSSTRLADAQQAPFALYGLTDEFQALRTLAGVGRNGDVVNLVSLGHGDPRLDPYVWVQVTVTGPLHGADPARSGYRSIDPRPMIAAELLNATGAEFSTTDALEQAVQQVVERSFADIQIRVDGRPESFGVWTEGDHWAALRDLEPDHLLYVIASNVAPSAIGLRQIDDDVQLYAHTPSLNE
jgi:hypothetical protein